MEFSNCIAETCKFSCNALPTRRDFNTSYPLTATEFIVRLFGPREREIRPSASFFAPHIHREMKYTE
jgi:hypothetical protein